ncbi:LytR C-terminal domain-containing protein [candidate division KSB1 bacterium]|nr:LytR C-terminal domain-containing protein [candidate division KSB1 bacterium]
MEKTKTATVKEKFKSGSLFVLNVVLFAALLLFIVSWTFHEIRAKGEQPEQTGLNIVGGVPNTKTIHIEVLNGCGVNRLALNLTNYLRTNQEFDVVDFTDYDRFDIPETLVIDRVSMDMKRAKKVGQFAGISSRNIFPQISDARNADVTIIIGTDYQNLKAFQ